MDKLYLYGIILVAAVLALYFYGESKYQAGIAYCENQQREAQLDQLRKDSETVIELEKEDAKDDKIVTEIKEVIGKIPDTSGCADIPIPERVTNCMRKFFDSGATSGISEECSQDTSSSRDSLQ